MPWSNLCVHDWSEEPECSPSFVFNVTSGTCERTDRRSPEADHILSIFGLNVCMCGIKKKRTTLNSYTELVPQCGWTQSDVSSVSLETSVFVPDVLMERPFISTCPSRPSPLPPDRQCHCFILWKLLFRLTSWTSTDWNQFLGSLWSNSLTLLPCFVNSCGQSTSPRSVGARTHNSA